MKFIQLGVWFAAAASLTLTGCAMDTATPPASTALVNNAATSPTMSVLGSKWHYADEQWQYDIEFAPNGVLRTTHPNDKTKDNDSWEQNGVNVTFYFNDKFSTYTGKLWSGVLMSGTATNKKGTTWSWKATRAN
jgi:outer membrane biogenesis lipoprotein LolB